MNMPDITPAQVGALLAFIGSQLVALTLISNSTAQLVTQVGGIVVPAAWKVADAIIRHGRSRIAAAEAGAKAGR